MKKMAIETDFAKQFENLRKICVELEEKSKKDEMRCLMLETEVEDLKKKNQELKGKIKMMQKVLFDSTCVKKKLKEKVKQLEAKIVQEDVNVVSRGTKQVFHSRVRKRLSFEEEDGWPNKKMAPSTPGVIDISDEDVNYNEIPKVKNVRKWGDLTKSQCSRENDLQKTNLEHTDEEFRVRSSSSRSAKRRRAAQIVASDDEEEVKENVSRRRYLTRLRKSESNNKQDKCSFDLNKTAVSSDVGEKNDGVDESESEGESLGGFIVDGSESSESADESDDALNEYKAALDKIGRRKIPNRKWDLEGDMLSDFGKDPALCMSAVCALYRRQTGDEKASKVTRYHNERGFSQTDAWRASKLAEILTDGDPNGDLSVTVEELKKYDSKGIGLCLTLATKYSKQLFRIYQNKEDPYFPPQR
ncbi:hypothetical protein HanPI659440_Chr09g0332301 [Helianthus annuus]|nr:hypothetical protein HanPI659440_Chr09g0332301 [Helianthus annuus]